MKKIDVVIVGGGPAGASLAYTLHKRNISCCIIDKAIFPREKLCGGLITQKTIDIFKNIYGDDDIKYKLKTNEVGIYYKHDCMNIVKTKEFFLLVDRFEFDFDLILRYKEKDGLIFEGTTIQDLSVKDNYIRLSNDEEIQFQYLVGADGANSSIRHYIDKIYRPDGLCIEVNEKCKTNNNIVQLHFGILNKGYGWIFPKSDTLTIGYGGLLSKNSNLSKGFKTYMNQCNISSNEKIKGAPLTFGTYVKKPCKNNIFLIGDAAGLTDPVTGEGLYYALLSAYTLANSLSMNDKIESQNKYLKAIKKMHKQINKIKRMRNLFFNPFIMGKAMTIFKNHPNVIKFTCDNAISYYHISLLKLPLEYYKRKKRKDNNVMDL